VNINANDIDWQIGTLTPLQEVTLNVVTRLINSTGNPSIITNTAILNPIQAVASADVFTVADLPSTGEIPWWRMLLFIASGIIVTGVTLIGAGHVWSRVRRD
jgi:hypothetical protein